MIDGMTLTLLVTPEMRKNLPQQLQILNDWGNTTVFEPDTGRITYGDHMMVSGPTESIIEWLEPFVSFWKTKGSPQCEQFERMYIRSIVAPEDKGDQS